ncbi:MAG: glycosyltransferase family 2 protein [Phycisphaeraceae bacterium]
MTNTSPTTTPAPTSARAASRPVTLGAVVIGRNEGERLHRCLQSIQRAGDIPLVYVDSGSTDGSIELAHSLGVDVVHLDLATPFTAARARNAGLARLGETHPDLNFVQFVDGDCEMHPDWFDSAARTLAADRDLAIVCGRLRERNRDATIYNRLCDMEWAEPAGEVPWCGGIFLARIAPIVVAVGFREDVIAGEEPELCIRLRHAGWRIRRIDAEMASHDADVSRFHQWWRRSVRAGYSYAQGAHIHGSAPQRYWVRETRSNWLWGLLVPVLSLATAWPSMGASLLLLAAYPLLAARVYRHQRRRGHNARDARLYATFCVLGKVPAALGQAHFLADRLLRRRARIIEYKKAAQPGKFPPLRPTRREHQIADRNDDGRTQHLF